MTTEQAQNTLASLIDHAIARDAAGNVVMRQQLLKTIEDLPLPTRYVRAAVKAAGLLSVYQG